MSYLEKIRERAELAEAKGETGVWRADVNHKPGCCFFSEERVCTCDAEVHFIRIGPVEPEPVDDY